MADNDTTVCQFVGDPAADIAGIGLLVGFTGQAFLSLCLALWVFFFSRHGRLDMLHEEGSDEHKIEMKRLDMVQELLMIGNDIQVMTEPEANILTRAGIALMITAFVSYSRGLDVYHLHLIYDVVSFVGVSVASALVCYTFCAEKKRKYHEQRKRRATGLEYVESHGQKLPFWTSVLQTLLSLVKLDKKENPILRKFFLSGRYRAIFIFVGFFLALTILLNKQLEEWDLTVPGRCYNAAGTSAPGAHHPSADRVYVWITFSWMIAVMLFSMFDHTVHRHFILLSGFLQFPVHLYMMIALRTANQGRLGVTADEVAATAAAAAAAAAASAQAGPAANIAVRVIRRAARAWLAARQDDSSGGGGGSTESSSSTDSEATENEWDFGQTTAVLLLGGAFMEFLNKGWELYKFEKELKRQRQERHHDPEQRRTKERELSDASQQSMWEQPPPPLQSGVGRPADAEASVQGARNRRYGAEAAGLLENHPDGWQGQQRPDTQQQQQQSQQQPYQQQPNQQQYQQQHQQH